MKVTKKNIYSIKEITDSNKQLLYGLLEDIKELNTELLKLGFDEKILYIDYQDYHDEYSPERTDPCPDYYGYFTLRFISNKTEKCGIEMTIEELDKTVCSLINLIQFNNI